MSDPFVVVGGDAAGLSAASKAAREDPEREIVVFERGQWVSYAHCGTPYFVKGEVEHLTDLLSLSPDDVADRGIDLRRGHEVVGVDVDEQTVTVERRSDAPDDLGSDDAAGPGPGERETVPYDDCLLATGASAVTDPFPGTDLRGVHALHGLDAAAGIRAHLLDPGTDALADVGGDPYVDREHVERYGAMAAPETVAIVGGGYVGVEMAEAFSAHDCEVHCFQRGSHLLPPFADAVGEQVAATLREHDVALHLETEVARLVGDDAVAAVETADGERTPADLVLVGVGIRPNVDLVADAPVETGAGGAVAIDEYGRTSAGDVYAAGDCATMTHAVTGEESWVPLGLTANRAGRAVGQTVTGSPEPVGDVCGTAVVKAFAAEAGRTGILDHDEARAAGFSPVAETITTATRSGYYPGGSEITVTLVGDRDTGRLLGGALVGEDRAAIRVDTLATALELGATVADLERSDLAYAPPFSPVWDPVLTAAKVLRSSLE